MANGYYRIAASGDDCEATPSGWNYNTTYLREGNVAGTIYRTFLRFALDIPDGAVIDDARLVMWQDGTYSNSDVTGTIISLLDEDDCADFTASNPYSRTVCSSPAAVAWADIYGIDDSWRQSTDIKTLVQGFIDRAGYGTGQYMGLRLSADGGSSGQYWCSVQWDYGANQRRAMLVVAYHTVDETGKAVIFREVAASGDDTWMDSNDTASRSTEVQIEFGASDEKTPIMERAFARWSLAASGNQVEVPAGTTIDNAIAVMVSLLTNTNAFTAKIGALEDESEFTATGTGIYNRAIISGETDWAPASGDDRGIHPTSDFAARVQERTDQTGASGYDPDGTGDQPYLGIRISYGTGTSRNYRRQYASQDHTAQFAPLLILRFDYPKVYTEDCLAYDRVGIVATEIHETGAQIYYEDCVVYDRAGVTASDEAVLTDACLVYDREDTTATDAAVLTDSCLASERVGIAAADVAVLSDACIAGDRLAVAATDQAVRVDSLLLYDRTGIAITDAAVRTDACLAYDRVGITASETTVAEIACLLYDRAAVTASDAAVRVDSCLLYDRAEVTAEGLQVAQEACVAQDRVSVSASDLAVFSDVCTAFERIQITADDVLGETFIEDCVLYDRCGITASDAGVMVDACLAGDRIQVTAADLAVRIDACLIGDRVEVAAADLAVRIDACLAGDRVVITASDVYEPGTAIYIEDCLAYDRAGVTASDVAIFTDACLLRDRVEVNATIGGVWEIACLAYDRTGIVATPSRVMFDTCLAHDRLAVTAANLEVNTDACLFYINTQVTAANFSIRLADCLAYDRVYILALGRLNPTIDIIGGAAKEGGITGGAAKEGGVVGGAAKVGTITGGAAKEGDIIGGAAKEGDLG